MASTIFKVVSFLFVLSSAEGLRKPRGVAGDPVPPPYPVVNVHIPEPTLGADDFKSAVNAYQHERESLLSLEDQISAMERQTLTTMAALSQGTKNVADIIESKMPI